MSNIAGKVPYSYSMPIESPKDSSPANKRSVLQKTPTTARHVDRNALVPASNGPANGVELTQLVRDIVAETKSTSPDPAQPSTPRAGGLTQPEVVVTIHSPRRSQRQVSGLEPNTYGSASPQEVQRNRGATPPHRALAIHSTQRFSTRPEERLSGLEPSPYGSEEPSAAPRQWSSWDSLVEHHRNDGKFNSFFELAREEFRDSKSDQLGALHGLIEQAEQLPGGRNLGSYYAQFQRATNPAIRSAFPDRTIATLTQLVTRNTAPERFEKAVTQSIWLDPIRQILACETVYTTGWGPASVAGWNMLSHMNNAWLQLFANMALIGLGGQIGGSIAEKARMGRKYTEDAKVVQIDGKSQLVNHKGSWEGTLVRGFSFIYFMFLLVYISTSVHAENPRDTKSVASAKAQQSFMRFWAGYVSSVGVGAHQAGLLALFGQRHLPWVDGREANVEAMFDTLEHLNRPMCGRVLSYIKDFFVDGVAGTVKSPCPSAESLVKALFRAIGALGLFASRVNMALHVHQALFTDDMPDAGNVWTDFLIATLWGFFPEFGRIAVDGIKSVGARAQSLAGGGAGSSRRQPSPSQVEPQTA